MTFTVKYRAGDGKMREECIEAASRSECVAKCKAQGIAPISVKEGGKVSSAGTQSHGERRALGGKLTWIIAGIIALVGVLWWFLGADVKKEEASKPAPQKQKQIVDVRPAKPKPMVKKEEVKKPVDPNARPTKSCEVVNGYIKLPSGRIHKISGVVTNSIANRPKAKYQIFKRNCNNEIAAYLSIKPGDTIVGTPIYNGRFKKDFLESLEEPIIVNDDDTPEDAQLKKDVIAARLELKDAMDRGEDIEQIMLDTRKELQRLMVAKMQLKQLFYEERKKCETDKDVEELFGACNKMLEEKGIAPLTYGPITKRNLMRSQKVESNQ